MSVFALLALAFVVLERWTDGAWADPVVDFGRELYVPWRLSEGAVLYRDIAWFNGPLSQWLNACLFRLVGASFRTLTTANLIVLALGSTLYYLLLRRAGGRFAATFALLLFLALSGFGHLGATGNFNLVAPYAHEIAHGFWLALVALAGLFAWFERRTSWSLAWTGMALGLCFLTKAEVFIAIALTVAVLLGLDARSCRASGRSAPRAWIVAASALAPPLAAWMLLRRSLGGADAWRAVLGSWPWIFDSRVAGSEFYRRMMGVDEPGKNLAVMLAATAAWLALTLLLAALARLAARLTSRPVLLALALAPLTLAGLLETAPLRAWWLASRALPLLALAAVLAWGWRVLRGGQPEARDLQRLALSLFALVLLAKVVLATPPGNYGFVLAAPAISVLVLALLGWMPERMESWRGAGTLLRGLAIGVLLTWTIALLAPQAALLREMRYRLGGGSDAMRCDRRALLIADAMHEIERVARPGDRLVVLPEGVMVNWLLRRRSPSRFVNFMPPELAMFGELNMLEDLRRDPPELVLKVSRRTLEYGLPLFGVDYGSVLAAWVDARYVAVGRDPASPLRIGDDVSFTLMRHRASPPDSQ